ncbi:hypothetical protein [Streptomyces sp. NPDC046261]|uniref:hypothetical protein n=1 Tax=Streptomyces sp. NPDC046261 TaxID=3157200 RepID=UPI0033F8C85B
MALSQHAKWWLGGLLSGLALIGLGVFLVVQGLDRADQIASVLGLFVGLAGLGLAAYGAFAVGRPGPPPAGGQGEGVHGNVFHGPAVIQNGDNNRLDTHRFDS